MTNQKTKPRPAAKRANADTWGVWMPCISHKEARMVLADVKRNWGHPIGVGKDAHPSVRRVKK